MALQGQQTRVHVVVRVRPRHNPDDSLWVEVKDQKTLLTFNHKNQDETLQYEFESVFDPSTSQKLIYEKQVKPLLEHTVNGRNASVFAYGPTGAGKTHTILGTATDPGVIPRCVKGLFTQIEEKTKLLAAEEDGDMWEFKVKFSYLEIYNEKVQDLLRPGAGDLPIREDQNKRIFVTGLTEETIDDIQGFNIKFGPASKNRTTAATKINERSSRSHSLLMLKVERRQTVAPFRRLTGKMYIIDLAGSEDNRRTGNKGIRLKESGAINMSLLALGQVVDALNRGQPCVPYRNSKLTRLLQDSIGGNAHSCMIVNLSPEERHYFDTYTTLNFARKAKKIVNTVRVNETVDIRSKTIIPVVDTPETLKENIPETPTSHKSLPIPFLSPLLKNQERFKVSIQEDMVSRLEEMERRLMEQMKQAGVTVPGVTVPGVNEPGVNEPNSTTDLSVLAPPQPLKKRKLPFQKDGSCDQPALTDISNSPLFYMPSKIRRKGFQSTASKSKLNLEDDEKKSDSDSVAKQFNPDLQEAHNKRILSLLNTGSSKDLQTLQTVGSKRAQLIHSWRELQGHFASFEDLYNVPGLGSSYMKNFLKRNLVQLSEA